MGSDVGIASRAAKKNQHVKVTRLISLQSLFLGFGYVDKKCILWVFTIILSFMLFSPAMPIGITYLQILCRRNQRCVFLRFLRWRGGGERWDRNRKRLRDSPRGERCSRHLHVAAPTSRSVSTLTWGGGGMVHAQ
jgi:hypothetical protein